MEKFSELELVDQYNIIKRKIEYINSLKKQWGDEWSDEVIELLRFFPNNNKIDGKNIYSVFS
jgi:hypothetical protein